MNRPDVVALLAFENTGCLLFSMPSALLLTHQHYSLHSALNNLNVKTCLEKDEHVFGEINTLSVKNAQPRSLTNLSQGVHTPFESERAPPMPFQDFSHNVIMQKSSRDVKKQPANAGKQRHFWKRTGQFASGRKAKTLVETVIPLSNVKEEIYGALDELIAFETEFPVVAVGKALQNLRKQEQWQRIIQVSKWMLSKGQGQTMGTYDLMLNAYDMDARLEDAESLWEKVLATHTRSIPKKMFVRMMSIYKRREMPYKILEVFNQMQKLGIKPDEGTVKRVRHAYKQLGMPGKEEELTKKYSSTWKYYYFKGKTIRVPARQPNKSSRPDNFLESVDTSEE